MQAVNSDYDKYFYKSFTDILKKYRVSLCLPDLKL